MEGGPPEPIINIRNSMLNLANADFADSETVTSTSSDNANSDESLDLISTEENLSVSKETFKQDDNSFSEHKDQEIHSELNHNGTNLYSSIDLHDIMKSKHANNNHTHSKKKTIKHKDKKNKNKKHHHQDPPCREPPKDGIWPKRDFLSFTRSLVFYGYGSITPEHEIAANYINEARNLRKKYFGNSQTLVRDELDVCLQEGSNNENMLDFRFGNDGIIEIFTKTDTKQINSLITVPTIDEFITDYDRIVEMTSSGSMRTFSFQRLQMLTQAFKMHVTANGLVENEAQSNLLGTDFYRTMKVDNHIHLAAAPSAKQFVDFVRNKLVNEGDTIVLEDGKSLRQVFTDAGLDLDHLTIDAFNVLADYSVYQRFDNFNSKYSPFRLAQMRKIFLKTSNCLEGRYFAELTKIVLARLEASKGHNSAAEMRLSIYGMERDEWLHLAKWVLRKWDAKEEDCGLFSSGPVLSTHNRWIIQVPRLWRIFHNKKGEKNENSKCFQDMLENLFVPIVEATLDPKKHPEVAELLTHIVGFDSVDDEGTIEEPGKKQLYSHFAYDKEYYLS